MDKLTQLIIAGVILLLAIPGFTQDVVDTTCSDSIKAYKTASGCSRVDVSESRFLTMYVAERNLKLINTQHLESVEGLLDSLHAAHTGAFTSLSTALDSAAANTVDRQQGWDDCSATLMEVDYANRILTGKYNKLLTKRKYIFGFGFGLGAVIAGTVAAILSSR